MNSKNVLDFRKCLKICKNIHEFKKCSRVQKNGHDLLRVILYLGDAAKCDSGQ